MRITRATVKSDSEHQLELTGDLNRADFIAEPATTVAGDERLLNALVQQDGEPCGSSAWWL